MIRAIILYYVVYSISDVIIEHSSFQRVCACSNGVIGPEDERSVLPVKSL